MNYEELLVGENENFRGKTLGNWMADWTSWLHSAFVRFRHRPGEVLFSRGALEYEYDPVSGQRRQKETFYNRDTDDSGNFLGEFITSETAIYINVSTANYLVGENYFGTLLNSLEDCMYVCRSDVQEGIGYYLKIRKEGEDEVDLLPNYAETTVDINVPADSELASRFEVPVKPNNRYQGFSAGHARIIKRLPEGRYFIRVGARGSRGYITDAKYQLRVVNQEPQSIFTDVDRFTASKRGEGIKGGTGPESEPNVPSPLRTITPPELPKKKSP